MARLAVAATACLGVDPLQADVRADAIGEGVASVDIAGDVGSSHSASKTSSDVVRDGYGIWLSFCVRFISCNNVAKI